MLANVHAGDLDVLFVILAVLAFGAAIWCAVNRRIVEAAVATLVGVILLVV